MKVLCLNKIVCGIDKTNAFKENVIMDAFKDKISGAKDKIKGEAKEKFGELTDNKKKEVEGKVDQAKGEAKKKYGDTKDKINDTFNEYTNKEKSDEK